MCTSNSLGAALAESWLRSKSYYKLHTHLPHALDALIIMHALSRNALQCMTCCMTVLLSTNLKALKALQSNTQHPVGYTPQIPSPL
jgi:hypothetical protein